MLLHSHPAQSHLWWCRVPLKATFGGVAFRSKPPLVVSRSAQSHLWWCRVPLKATFGGVAFRLKKLKEKFATEMGREKK